jgi:hypothetical protein
MELSVADYRIALSCASRALCAAGTFASRTQVWILSHKVRETQSP